MAVMKKEELYRNFQRLKESIEGTHLTAEIPAGIESGMPLEEILTAEGIERGRFGWG